MTATQGTGQKMSQREIDSWLASFIEIAFVLLPFAVIAMVFIYQGHVGKVFYLPEWSLAAAVMIGQAIAKFTRLITRVKVRSMPATTLVVSMVVFLLIPTLVLLSIMLLAAEITRTMATVQLILFCIVMTVFLFVNWISEHESPMFDLRS
jgi:hypothetical protein